jgi:hypothetical protein
LVPEKSKYKGSQVNALQGFAFILYFALEKLIDLEPIIALKGGTD